jgi:4-hydroxybenzoate polyprenyltransferase
VIFAQRMIDAASLTRVALGVLSFCLLASAVYLGNDIADREKDRAHPEKSRRPIASGEVPIIIAGITGALLVIASFAIGRFLGPLFLACIASYLVLQLLYTTMLKHMVVLDVFAIATGFVIRVVAGAEAIEVPISNWLYLCTMLLSLFLALAKRRAELSLLAQDAGKHRKILEEYSIGLVDQLITIVAGCTVLAYALYTLAADTIQKFGTDKLKFTVPLVLFGLFRYLYLVHKQGEGGKPEKVLFRDRPTQVNLLCYLAVVIWAIYGA